MLAFSVSALLTCEEKMRKQRWLIPDISETLVIYRVCTWTRTVCNQNKMSRNVSVRPQKSDGLFRTVDWFICTFHTFYQTQMNGHNRNTNSFFWSRSSRLLPVRPDKKRENSEKMYGCRDGGHGDGWCSLGQRIRGLKWQSFGLQTRLMIFIGRSSSDLNVQKQRVQLKGFSEQSHSDCWEQWCVYETCPFVEEFGFFWSTESSSSQTCCRSLLSSTSAFVSTCVWFF